jgi:hypothetical protein
VKVGRKKDLLMVEVIDRLHHRHKKTQVLCGT